MTERQAFSNKRKVLSDRCKTVRRCNSRPPRALEWLACGLGLKLGNTTKKPPPGIPPGFWWDKEYAHTSGFEAAPLDRLARTFCAMEELESWLDRVDAGQLNHQQEIERQAAHKITRLKTAAALGTAPSTPRP